MNRPILIFLSLFMFANLAYADVYLWEDENEKVYTTNNIENVPEEYKDVVEVYKEGEEDPLDKVTDVSNSVADEEGDETEESDQTNENGDSKVEKDFRNLSAEDKIKSMQNSYDIGSALDILKAKMKAKQNN